MADQAIGRRRFLKQAAAGVGALGAATALAGCTSEAQVPKAQQPQQPQQPQPAQPAQQPQAPPTGAVAAQGSRTLRTQASWPAASLLFENYTLLADRVDKMSGGRVRVQTQPGGAIVGPFEVLDATHTGTLDGAHSWAGYWIGKHRASVLFTGGPGGPWGMDYIDYMGWIYEGGGIQLYEEFYRDILRLDVIPIPVMPAGPQSFGWFKKPIRNLNDLVGLKYRTPGVNAEIMQQMGVSVVTLAGAEILPAAERGVIDAAEWAAPAEDQALGFQDVWKYHVLRGMHETVTSLEFIINRGVWESLSSDLQEIIRAACTETYFRWWVRFLRQNADAMAELRQKGVEFTTTPEDIALRVLDEWDKISEADAAKDPFYKKVRDSQRDYASKVVPTRREMFWPYNFVADRYWKA